MKGGTGNKLQSYKKQVSLDKNSIHFSFLIGMTKQFLKHNLEDEKFEAFESLILCKSHRKLNLFLLI